MKTIHFFKTHILLVAALLIAGVTMSFSESHNDGDKTPTVHYYVSSDMSAGAFRNVANWSTVNNSEPCLSEEDARPCQITVPAGTSLNSVLAGKSNPQVLAISEGYKPEL